MKLRTSRTGHSVGGRAFDKSRLWGLLTNWTYVGKVRYRGEVYDGEHPAIVPPELWAEVQDILKRHGRGPRGEGKIRHESLLRGLLVCAHCETALVNHFTSRGPNRRYHYYVCSSALKNGWGSCPTKALPAGEVDGFVVAQLREIASDRRLRAEVVRFAREATESGRTALEADDVRIRAELRAARAEVKRLAGSIGRGSSEAADRLVEIQANARRAEAALEEIEAALRELAAQEITDAQVVAALAAFEPSWGSLTAAERGRIARLLLERVVFDPASGSLRMTFRPTGIRSLAAQAAAPSEEA
jgi:site-specific DNA recombinase